MEDIPEIYPTIELQTHDRVAGVPPDAPGAIGLPSHIPPWSALPLSPSATSQNSQSAPYSFSAAPAPTYHPAAYDRPYPQPHRSSASSSSRDVPVPGAGGAAAAKVAIPRAAPYSTHAQRRRSARACEPCRQRKIKCDGNKPVCRQCQEHHVSCSYLDVKRVRDQKQLGTLSRRVERYERLLRGLETEVEGHAARRIRRALKASTRLGSEGGDGDGDGGGGDSSDGSTSSAGSLTAIDLVDEDLNRSEKSRAAGYFGKNSEVSWMQKLEDEAETRHRHRHRHRQVDFNPEMQGDAQHATPQKHDVPIAAMSYHLDDLEIPLMDDVDPFALPPKRLADRFLAAYIESLYPAFEVVRKSVFVKQYQQFFSQPSNPPRRWLAILNMVFALGCRYCRLLNDDVGLDDAESDGEDWNDLVYLNRARKLCLDGNVLFEYTDLQQIQVEVLVALYLLVLGRINRASNFAGMAFRSALSLGINLRFEDERMHHSSKEARGRLWWSIYALEHLLTATTGRASCVSEALSSAPLPIPFEEERFDTPEARRLFQDPALRARYLKLSLFETEAEARAKAQWLAGCEPSASLFFHCLVDLDAITQAVIKKIYSIQGLRHTAAQLELRVHKYSSKLDSWLSKLPPAYRFTVSSSDDTLRLDTAAAAAAAAGHEPPFMRERVCLAFTYYSARITISRPCLTHPHVKPSSSKHTVPASAFGPGVATSSSSCSPDPPKRSAIPTHSTHPTHTTHTTSHRASMSLACLRASCSLIDILPETPDPTWLVRFAPWWSSLHYIMQATTALLLGLSAWPVPVGGTSTSLSTTTSHTNPNIYPNPNSNQIPYSHPDTNLPTPIPTSTSTGTGTGIEPQPQPQPHSPTIHTVLSHTHKSLRWLHVLGSEDAGARRAFVLCESFVRRIAPTLRAGYDLERGFDLDINVNIDINGGGGGREENGMDTSTTTGTETTTVNGSGSTDVTLTGTGTGTGTPATSALGSGNGNGFDHDDDGGGDGEMEVEI